MLIGISALLVFVLIGCGDSGSGSNDTSQLSTPVLPPPETETIVETGPTPPPTPTIFVVPEVAAAVDKLLDGQRGVYGIVLTRPDGSFAYQHNADTPFVA